MPRDMSAAVAARRASVLPLEEFPADAREEILRLVAQESPPPGWRDYGPPGSPAPLVQMESRAWHEWHWARGRLPGETRAKLPAALRQQVIDRDGYVCGICHGDVDPDDLHLDHIKPWSKGGRDVLGNLRVTHSLCNIRRGARGE